MPRVDYLIIGGGIAGTTAAETIRKLDQNGTIVIVSEEPHPLYSRVLLPHYIRGRVMREFVFLRKDEWYTTHAITLLKGRLLHSLRPAAHEAVLDDGTVYQYRKLLLATGGRVRRFPLPELVGVTYLRTIEDADAILNELDALEVGPPSQKIGVIYGGGFIGLEYAPIFRERGLETHLLIRDDRYWAAYFNDASEQLMLKIFAEQDIHLHRNVEGVKVEGSAHVEAVDISGTRIAARIMGIGVGLVPNFEAVRDARIEVRRGIVTSEYLETNAPDVWAAGDVAEFLDMNVGHHRILGNWINAQQHGMRAGANMVGDRKPLEVVSAYSTSPFGISITFVGDVAHHDGTEVITRGSPDEGAVGQIFLLGGRIVGTTLINMNRERTPLTELIRQKTDVRGFLKQLADPATDIATLL